MVSFRAQIADVDLDRCVRVYKDRGSIFGFAHFNVRGHAVGVDIAGAGQEVGQ